jgi:transcriptional regulator with XRE-family HTH domain
MSLAERVLLRIREEMAERKISQRDLAHDLHCSQGRVAKILNGGVNLRVNDIAVLADAVGITPVEALRDRGLEFFAELTPSEVRILERLRRRPHALQGALLMLGLSDDDDIQKPKRADAKRDTGKRKRS